jgi:glycosyltransferase involved in cell wall biosynthesis
MSLDRGRLASELTVRYGPDALVLYRGGVRRTAIELIDATRAIDSSIDVMESAEQHARSDRPALSTARRALLQTMELASNVGARRGARARVVHSLYYDPAHGLVRAPKVVTVYDMIHERFSVGRALQTLKRRSVQSADCVVVPSQSTADDVRSYFPSVNNVVVIQPGISHSMLHDAHHRHDAGRPYLLYVGPRHGYKNFSLLLESFRLLARSDMQLVLAGGEPLDDPQRRNLVLATGSADRFVHVRPDDRELVRLYDGAAALVVTSRYEGFGLPIVEAMARGCPVASSLGGSLIEASGGFAQHFDPDSAEQCAAAIDRAVEASPALIEQAKAYAQRLTWNASAVAHLELYASV